MRFLSLLSLACALLVALVVATPAPRDSALQNNRRVGVSFGNKDANLAVQRDRAAIPAKADKDDGAANYLVTLDRTISNVTKDKILDMLLRLGAVVKQEYNYRVYKGILFTVPSAHDKGLSSWQSSLLKLAGVKYVEEDSLMTTQPVGAVEKGKEE
ncbi:hypothetical protein JCM10450v2_000894 [Rhodotorula kratochvilovae]